MAKTLKTFNDPIYGFITIEDDLIFKLLEHPHFQRLRRIAQLGLTNLVYSGANHSRFQHALGAMNLMKSAIANLRIQGIAISEEEEQGAKIAILLHDIGHGPFSHALENTIVRGVNHEQISLIIMNELNLEFDQRLDLGIAIYQGTYPVKFLHQLVSSQLDMDRLDYLKRDSFFTGVAEGGIGSERIIKMLTVIDDQLVVDAKGIYSLEHFLIARRLMYWQVYLHKTVLSAEFMLMNTLLRARQTDRRQSVAACSKALLYFLNSDRDVSIDNQHEWLPKFLMLDDFDIMASIKQWRDSEDMVLRELSSGLIERKLLKTKLVDGKFTESYLSRLRQQFAQQMGWTEKDAEYMIFDKTMTNQAYNPQHERINIVFKDGSIQDIASAAGIFQFSSLNQNEEKRYLYYPAGLQL